MLTTPAIRAVRMAFPDARISLLVKPWVADIFRENPDINEIILYEKKHTGISGRFKLAKLLRARGFDAAILLQNAFDAAFIAWLAGIPERIGYSRDWRKLFLTKAIPIKKGLPKQHQVYYYLDLLEKSLHISHKETEPFINLSRDEMNNAGTLLSESLDLKSRPPVIGINPGAAYGPAKRWMPERFAGLINRIINELDGRVVLFGSESEIEISSLITSSLSVPPSTLLNMTGRTGLRQLASLIAECDAFITNDSGPMHMAAALLTPVVAIFGSTDRTETYPFGEGHRIVCKDLKCSPCLKRECPVGTTRSREGHLKCMDDITTEDVFKTLKDILPKEKAVFLDRDGTLNDDVGYLKSFSDLKLFKDALPSLEKLKKAGFKLIGVTNQSGIARGFMSKDFVLACNAYVQKTLGIDDFYFCPHHPDTGCRCRKPKPFFLRKARLKHNIDLKTSYVVGDKTIDLLLAKNSGSKGILVQTGHDKGSEHADFIAKNLTEAADWILKDSNQ